MPPPESSVPPSIQGLSQAPPRP